MISHVNKLHSQRHGFLLHFHTLVSFKSAFLTFDRESALKKFYSREDENLGKETSLYSINQKCVVEMSSKPRREDSELQRLYPVRFKQVYYFKNALSRSSLQLKSVERVFFLLSSKKYEKTDNLGRDFGLLFCISFNILK